MRSFRVLLASAAITGGVLAASQAEAGDIACVWNALPRPIVEAYLKAYAKIGPDASHTIGATPEMLAAATQACHITGGGALGAALADYAWKAGAASVLHDQFGVDEARILDAYNRVNEADRQAFVAAALSHKAMTMTVTDAVVADLGTDPHKSQGQVFVYLTSMVMVEEAQKAF